MSQRCLNFVRSWLVLCLILPPAVAPGQPNSWAYIGPDGGAVSALAEDPTNANVLFATSSAYSSTRMFKSTNRGQTWAVLGPVETSVTDILINRTATSVMYAYSIGTVRKSTNGGLNWTYLPLPSMYYPYRMVLDWSDNSIVHGAGYYYDATLGKTRMAYMRSTNGGTTWSTTTIPDAYGYAYAIAIDAVNNQHIYIGGYFNEPTYAGKVYKSTNGGATFFDCTGGIAAAVNDILADPSVGGKVFAASSVGVYRTTDGGGTWTMNSGYIPIPTRLAKSPANSTLLMTTTTENGIYKSTDGGINWTSSGNGIGSMRCLQILIDRSNAANMLCVSSAGVTRSTNTGVSWSPSNTGLIAASVSVIGFAPSLRSRGYIGVEPDGVYRTSNLTAGTPVWERVASFATCRETVPGLVVAPGGADSVFVLEGGG